MRELLAAALLSLPLPPSWTVVVNGQPLRERAVLVRGQPYLPLDALRDLGVSVTLTGREIRLSPTGAESARFRPGGALAEVRRPQQTGPALGPVPGAAASRPVGGR